MASVCKRQVQQQRRLAHEGAVAHLEEGSEQLGLRAPRGSTR